MKLYYSPAACSLSPHIVSLEAAVPVTVVKVDLKTHRTEHDEDYYAVNPKGYVPALSLDDGQTLTEGPAIVQYLADQKPESGLVPGCGTFARYKIQEWLTFINGEMHKPFGVLFRGSTGAALDEAIEKISKRFAFVEKGLGDKPFLTGEIFTVADAYFFVILFWAHRLRVDIAPYPLLQGFYTRVSARPKVQAALKAEGLVR
jgi:glutathione S-transferase